MTNAGSVLIIDDDPLYWATYREFLEEEGFLVAQATDKEGVLSQLQERSDWDAILLDVKLRGREGPDDGLDLLEDIMNRAPMAKVLMVSGLAGNHTVGEAFRRGVFDYLDKGSRIFWELLRAKLRAVTELLRERRLGELTASDREHLLVQLYQELRQERERAKKGALLEELTLLLFKTIPGFYNAQSRLRSAAEELDLVVANESDDKLWSQEGTVIIVECKNWSRKTEREELDKLALKMLRRGDRCRLGFFVAVGGFSAGFANTAAAPPVRNELIVPIGPDELRALVEAGSGTERNERLKAIYVRSAARLAT